MTITFLVLAALPAAADARGRSSVAALQVGLRAVGTYSGTIDGLPGPATRAAVVAFQRHRGLVADGIAGRRTRRALGRRGRPRLGRRVLTTGRAGWDVAQLQFLLAWRGFPSGTIDGGFGPRLRSAVVRFQQWARLVPDGVAGPATVGALRRRVPGCGRVFAHRPVGIRATERFGPRGDRFHAGLDFPAAHGTRVSAARRGRVAFAGFDPGGFGNLVVVVRGGRGTWYAHLSALAVRRGQRIRAGHTLGRVGATGFASGPNLHFEVRQRGASVDPQPCLP